MIAGIRIQMLVFALALLPFTNVVVAEEVFEFNSYKDVMIYFQELGYTEESWEAGNKEVHRVYLANMPSRWRGKHASEAEVKMKKEVFFRILAPLILRSNELIMQDRVRLQSISDDSEVDAVWLSDPGVRYRVLETIDDPVGPEQIKELIKRVDIVPPSLAMAQTAEESGWGINCRDGTAGKIL